MLSETNGRRGCAEKNRVACQSLRRVEARRYYCSACGAEQRGIGDCEFCGPVETGYVEY